MHYDFGPSALEVTTAPDGTLNGQTFPGRNGQIFGGQISALSISAASHHVPDGARPHALHLTYLAAGDPAQALDYHPEVVKRGRSFSLVRVDVRQGARHIATSTVSFHAVESSDEHGVTATAVPEPDECPPADLERLGGSSPVWDAVERRFVSVDTDADAPSMRLWMRWRAALGGDAVTRAGAVTWMSDLLMVRTSRLRFPADAPRPYASSLDHSVWFHREFDANDWLLMDSVSLVRAEARALGEVRVFDRAGRLVATAKQECLAR